MHEHPTQPVVRDPNGVLRFKPNAIIQHLLEVARKAGCGLNELALLEFSQEDRQQFAQLIGYSLSGYGDLSCVDGESYRFVEAMVEKGISEQEAKIAVLTGELAELRRVLREPMARLFDVHPDDLA